MKTRPTRKQLKVLCAACVLTTAALAPVAASAHTSVFFGLNLSSLFAPPIVAYRAPGYYAPAPTYYYAPPAVVETPAFVYYHTPTWRHRGWRPPHHVVRHWNRGHHGHYRHDARPHHWHH